ncbi:MAG: sterol desaturase family protein [Planctomycetes bacterium]|nr:sterol desaturase family protein [Planctomycetota bacterium]
MGTLPQRTRRVRAARAVSAIALWLGLLALPSVLCLLFPGPLSTESLRQHYPMPFIRGLIQGGIFVAIVLAIISLALKGQRTRGGIALVLAMCALALGGGDAQPVEHAFDAPLIGLDFLLLDLFALCLIFVPLERWLGRRQKVLRAGWHVDLAHFAASHVAIGVIALLSVAPAHLLFSWVLESEFRDWVASLHPVLQFVLVVLTVEFANYWVHRAFHRVPWLWRLHAVHHSSREMDWLAGSRLHLGDILITRAAGFVPVFVLGFEQGPIYAYVLLISFHAVLIHANARIEFGWLDRVLTSPKFHHWHHADKPEALDKNFAVLVPLWDDLFGTALRTRQWPQSYGLIDGEMPESWAAQFVHPFRRAARAKPEPTPQAQAVVGPPGFEPGTKGL